MTNSYGKWFALKNVSNPLNKMHFALKKEPYPLNKMHFALKKPPMLPNNAHSPYSRLACAVKKPTFPDNKKTPLPAKGKRAFVQAKLTL
ncbi:hypothetical protein [Virgibacillus siamensis]|uniref:hypothetical protein n=1 Tax=Virgibacillus siamensis TaxID=480071 RepID=UPI000985B7FC|nr:hypothetical protein [Virgibacillus siamensis]